MLNLCDLMSCFVGNLLRMLRYRETNNIDNSARVVFIVIVWMPVCSIASYILMAVVVRIFYATNIIAWFSFP